MKIFRRGHWVTSLISYFGMKIRLVLSVNNIDKNNNECCFQKMLMHCLSKRLSLLIIGDYGSGKTLVLDGATNELVDQNVPVYFFCALDYEEDTKTTDDMLDVILRLMLHRIDYCFVQCISLSI